MNKEAVIREFEEGIARLKAIEPGGYILAWDNGLAVKFFGDKPYAVGIAEAEVLFRANKPPPEDALAYIPNVANGHKEQAKIILQEVAAGREIAKLEKMIARLKKDEAA